MSTYYQGNRERLLEKAKHNCKSNKEGLKEQAQNRYRELPNEEKNMKRKYRKNRC